jgi:hypothetical protein
MTFAYRWQRCDKNGNSCGNISGATNQSFVVRSGDVGRRLRLSVTATNSDGSANAVSAPPGLIANGAVPDDTVAPVVSGALKVGNVLSTTNGSWKNDPTSFSYEWDRCDTGGRHCRSVGSHRHVPAAECRRQGDDLGDRHSEECLRRDQLTSAPTLVAAARLRAGLTSSPQIGARRAAPDAGRLHQQLDEQPTRYDHQWLRCDTHGTNCGAFGGSNSLKLSSPRSDARSA